MGKGVYKTVPSPVSGVVVAVNEQWLERPSTLLAGPLEQSWIAHICPTRIEAEREACQPRRVMLANADPATAQEQADKLAAWGCDVKLLGAWKDVTADALGRGDAVVVLDAASFGRQGPELVRRINNEAPSARIVVVTTANACYEAEYREAKILYYAVEPFEDGEIVDILDTAFRTPDRDSPHQRGARVSGEVLSRICMTNGSGARVGLMAGQGLLGGDAGLGRQIASKLQERLYTVETTGAGDATMTPITILDAAQNFDRLLVLVAKDTGRLPGSLVRGNLGECASTVCDHAGHVTTITVQPSQSGAHPLEFDAWTTAALAEHIAREMELCYQAALRQPGTSGRPHADTIAHTRM